MARKIRIECEQRTRAGGVLKDLRTGQQACFNRGEAIVLELGIFANGRMLQRAEITSLKVRWLNAGTLLSETVVSSASLSASLVVAQWRQGNAALALVTFDDTATGDLPAGFLTLEVKVTTAEGESIFASGTVEAITLPGLTTGTPPTPGPPTSYTKAESDAQYEPIGTGSGNADDIDALETFLDYAGETESGLHLRAVTQSFTTAEKLVARTNIGALIGGGLQTITGAPFSVDMDTGLTVTGPTTTPRGDTGACCVVTPDANTEINLRIPALPIGVPHMLQIQQGFVVHWTSAYTFPTNEITCGASSGDFAKKSWHPETGEGYEKFELVYDGTTTHVRRWRHTARPDSIIDFDFNRPFTSGSISTIADRDTGANTTGFYGTGGTYGTLTGSGLGAGVFSAGAFHYAVPAIPYAQGYAIAIVFEASSGSADQILFSLPSLGVEATMQTSGSAAIRFKPIGSSATAGLKVSDDFSVPVAAVIVVKAGSAGAFVLTTSDLSGGNTGSFTPAATSGTTGYWGGNASGNYLSCKIARFRIIPVALNPDQARAELDALTAAYKIG